MMGKIEVFLGPMFSGKTAVLINKIKKLKSQSKKVKVFKPVVDNRYGKNLICSHDKVSLKAYNIKNVEEAEVNDCDVIVFDEYFFFKDDLLDYCLRWKKEGKHVILAGLDLDYTGSPIKFVNSNKSSEDLIRIADEVHFLKARCVVCNKEATMTERIAKSNDIHLVGGAESYRAVCKEHHPRWKGSKSR